jgi:L-lactate utilization protein LutB
MITTIPEYCKQRGITRQFVYSYIKSGKFKHYEMPTFVEINGEKINIGVQKILEVPEEFAPKKTDLKPITDETIGNLDELLNRITDNLELKAMYRHFLSAPSNADKKAKKEEMDAMIEAHPDRDTLRVEREEASIRLMQHMVQLNGYLDHFLAEARAAVAEPA